MNTSQTNTLSSRQRQERVSILLTCTLGVLLLYMSFLITYHLTHDLKTSDFIGHIKFMKQYKAAEMIRELLTGNDLLWHLMVKVLARLGKMSFLYAACIVTTGTTVATYGIACGLLRSELKQVNRALIPVAAFALCIVGPVYLPWFNEKIYLGQGSPNIWHSPTHLTIRPIAVLTFGMTILIYNRLRQGDWPTKTFKSKGEAALYTVLLTVGIMAKPSYFQGAVPALAILMIVDLIRSKGKAFLFCFKMAAAHIPAAILTFVLFFKSFYTQGGGGDGIEIAFLDVWGHSTKSVPLSILLLLAFPIFVFIMDRKRIFASVEGQFSLAMLFTSGMMKALLAEKGRRRYSGNFGWGWGIAVFLIWFVALKEFLRMMTGDELSEREYKVAAYVGWTLLALHFFTGVVYYCYLMQGTGTLQC